MSDQPKLFIDENESQNTGPIICLGIEFENDDARREHYSEELREKLQDPDFRKIEGFPIGEDEDILKLSDPPYYTACPNPWIADFVEEWEGQKPEKLEGFSYHREPFAADVIEGKNNPIYNVHTYHTKVPHKAIMRYILHYTEPGDLVFDGFAGTGMTGVAAFLCGNRSEVISLGYQVMANGIILRQEINEEGEEEWKPFSKLGIRKAILNDLSPAASFIAYNYNTPVDLNSIINEAKNILVEVEEECGWMYETYHTDGTTKGKINYVVWSDVFVCPKCSEQIVFWDTAVKLGEGIVLKDFQCNECRQWLSKSPANSKKEATKSINHRRKIASKVERAWSTEFDSSLNSTIKQAKQVPVLISYIINNKKFKKTPDEFDLNLIAKINALESEYWFPKYEIPKGDKTSDPFSVGITHIHHFYSKRNLLCFAAIWNKLNRKTKWIGTSFLSRNLTKGNRYVVNSHNPMGRVNGPFTGTFYIPSEVVEQSAIELFKDKGIKVGWKTNGNLVQSSSTTDISHIPSNSTDYLFFDPPFGANIMYSELSFLWESWLSVFTNNSMEAIENKTQGKSINDYRDLMVLCFKEAYRVLKPGRWMTVEFSNTKASVWNSIQNALSDAGFIVSNVSVLDKKHGGIKAMTTLTNVKQDLVISAYKPNGGFEERFEKEANTVGGVWEFIRTHLNYLPVTKKQGAKLIVIPERDPRILYDQVIAYYVRKGLNIPVDSKDFQLGLSQRFSERDGMYFLPEQVAEYDRKRMISGGRAIQQSLFVFDEASAIDWLRNLLRDKPQSFQDINPLFMKEISGWSKNEIGIELSILLEQNFLGYDGNGLVPEQIHSYLSSNWKEMRNLSKDDLTLQDKAKNRWYVPDPNKVGDLEKLREKALLKEFEEYKKSKKKLKVFRLEAVRAGFKKAWQDRDYEVIIAVAEKIPNKVLEEDPKLLMWFDQAVTRSGTN
jgi:DNA modification methylase